MDLFEEGKMVTLKGQGIGDGICAGYLKYRCGARKKADAPYSRRSSEDEMARYEAARLKAKEEISKIEEELYNMCGAECAHVFATQMLLADEGIFTDVPRTYINMGRSAEQALGIAKEYFFTSLCAGKHRQELICLAPDVCDVAARILSKLTGEDTDELDESDAYLWITDMPMPSEIVSGRAWIMGIVSKIGFETTSSALVAKALEIPALATDADIFFDQPRRYAILDAKKGELCVNPDIAAIERFSERMSEESGKAAPSGEELAAEIFAMTSRIGDGYPQDIFLSESEKIDGELLCPDKFDTFDEDTLFETYRAVAERMLGGLTVVRSVCPSGIVRLTEELTSDGLGGARELYVVRNEELRIQLGAVMRAAVYGPLSFAVSLSDDADEICRLRFLQKELGQSLLYRGHEFSTVKMCAIIDTPAAALMCDKIIEVSDIVIIDICKLEAMLFDGSERPCGEARRRALKNIADCAQKEQKKTILLLRGEGAEDAVKEALDLGYSSFCAPAEKIRALKREIINCRKSQEK